MRTAKARLLLLLTVSLSRAAFAEEPTKTTGGARSAPARYAAIGMRAHLYYQGDGTTDSADILSGQFALWNTFIGGGDARSPAGAVLVLVEVEGPTFTSKAPAGLKLILTARASKRTIAEETVQLMALFSEGQRITVPVIVYETPCFPLELTARIEGAKQVGPPLTVTAPFRCGE